jgi:glycosyltransferase involved in cell wall biosynthesis
MDSLTAPIPPRFQESPLVSIIMNCLNGEEYLREAIDSVYSQTYPNWEIIFWDNASTDQSAAIAQSYDKKLRYFRGDQTVPLGVARNMALEQVQGEYIAFLDCDDLWLPKKLEKQIPFFGDPDVGLVFSDSSDFYEDGHAQRLYDTMPYCTGWCFPKLLSNYFLSIQTVIIRRQVLHDLDMWFDPHIETMEEADLFIRISYNWNLAMVAEPLARYRFHGSNRTWNNRHQVPDEGAWMLEKYSKSIPDFTTRFANEIRIVTERYDIQRSRLLWAAGDQQGARRYIAPYACKSLKQFLFYLITFLPHKLVLAAAGKLKMGPGNFQDRFLTQIKCNNR